MLVHFLPRCEIFPFIDATTMEIDLEPHCELKLFKKHEVDYVLCNLTTINLAVASLLGM
jgi:hypothetical protein